MNNIKIYKNKKLFFTIGISFITIITFFVLISSLVKNNKSNTKVLNGFGFQNMTLEEVVYGLDSNEIYVPNLRANITGSTLNLTNENSSSEVKIDNNLFYLSFAPYINKTHTCTIHNLITCKGELSNELFEVKVLNDNNQIIYNKTIESMSNGFIGIWLPKNISGKILVDYNGMLAEVNIQTNANSNTCLTTPLQLNGF